MSTSTHAGRGWFKSSFSDTSAQCVEVNLDGAAVLIRDSKYTGDPAAQPAIAIPHAQWPAFLAAVLDGGPATPAISRASDGAVTLSHNGVELGYTSGEWEAFRAGVALGEFSENTGAALV